MVRTRPFFKWFLLLFGIWLTGCDGSDVCNAKAAPATCSLKEAGRRYGFSEPIVRGRQIKLQNKWHRLEFETNGRRFLYDGLAIWLNAPVINHHGAWHMGMCDIEKTMLPLFAPSKVLAKAGYTRIVIDAGHGGDDFGACGQRRGSDEKRINLDISKRVSALLSPHMDVRLLRTDDKTLSLEDRVWLAKRMKPDIFISIHQNSAGDPNASGIETHVIPPAGSPITASGSVTARDRVSYDGNRFDGANMCLGFNLQRSLINATGAVDRGVRRSRFYVIRNIGCPSALIECGFLSNSAEERRLLSREYKDKLARSIADGVLAYVNAVKRARVSGNK